MYFLQMDLIIQVLNKIFNGYNNVINVEVEITPSSVGEYSQNKEKTKRSLME